LSHRIDLTIQIWRRRKKETVGEGEDPDPTEREKGG
jgi:hypothetical protein